MFSESMAYSEHYDRRYTTPLKWYTGRQNFGYAFNSLTLMACFTFALFLNVIHFIVVFVVVCTVLPWLCVRACDCAC